MGEARTAETVSPERSGQGQEATAPPARAEPSPAHPPAAKEREAWRHLTGAVIDGVHVLPIRVYYEDTDFSGIVYHANYLRFLERGRTEFLRAAGVDQSTLHAKGGLAFAVRHMTLDFLRPARMDDVLVVETRTEEVRGASLLLAQRILRGDEVLLTADVRVAAVSKGRPARIPEDLRAVLTPRAAIPSR